MSAYVGSASAQAFVVTHTDVHEGAYSVADTSVISFYFSKSLPFNTDFISGFSFVEPRGSLSVRGVLLDLDGNSRPRIARFTVAHRVQTDYTWVIYGIACNDQNVATNTNPVCRRGEYLDAPYVLNYSSAPTPGTLAAQGAIRTGSSPLVETVALPDQVSVASYGRVDASEMRVAMHAGKVQSSHTVLPEAALAEADEMKRTVVVMLSSYSTNTGTWRVRSAARVASDGSFSFSNLRPETLYPIAIRFKRNDNRTIEAFGIHDPEDRGIASSVDLSQGGVPSLVMRMYPFTSTSSRSAISRAGRAAGDETWSKYSIQDLSTVRVDPETGIAAGWTVGYLDEHDRYLTLSLDPLAARFTIPTIQPPLVRYFDPAAMLDSAEIVAVAEQSGGAVFREDNPGTIIGMRLGGSNETVRPESDVFWTVTYSAPSGDHRSYHLDPFDGRALGLIDTRADHPLDSEFAGITSMFPNPASDQSTLAFSIDPGMSASLEVFDVLGRLVHVESIESQVHTLRTSTFPAGVYLVRLNQGRTSWQRMMTVLR